MMENSEKTITDLFLYYKKEIPDKGFSQKVIRDLPEKKNAEWIIYLFALIGVTIFVFSGTYQWMITYLLELCKSFLIWKIPTLQQVGSYLVFMGIIVYLTYEFLFSDKKDDFLF